MDTATICRLCLNPLSPRDAATYGGRCEDCYAGGIVKVSGGPAIYVGTTADGLVNMRDCILMQRGVARNGQVVRSGRSHGDGM
jgi:hypothetical protein